MGLTLELGKFKLAVGKKPKAKFTEIGATGSDVWSGIFQDEYLTELSNISKKTTVYEKMRSGDGGVKSVLLAIELVIKSAEWFIEGGEDIDEEAVAFVKNALFERMSISFDEFMHHAISMMAFGWSMFEKVFKYEDNLIYWKKIAPRLQKSLYRWYLDENGGLKGIQQWVKKDGGFQRIDIYVPDLLVFTNMREGSNYEGTSILRSAYKHWFIKDLLYKIAGIGLERQAVGFPVGTLGEGYSDTDKTNLESLVQDMRTNEESGAVLPPGFDLKLLEGKIKSNELLEHIEHHDRMIAKSALASFLNLGGGKTGSFALSKDQSDFFVMAVNAFCKNIADTMNRFAIPQLIDYNPFIIKDKKYPKLAFSIGKIDPAQVIEGIEKMVEKKVVVPEKEDEDFVRGILGLPEVSEEVLREREEAEEPEIEGERKLPFDVTMRERHRRRRMPSLKLADRKYRRELTKWEQGVKFKELDDRWTKEEEALISSLFAVSDNQVEDLMGQIERALRSGKLNDLYKLTVRNRGDYAQTLRSFMKELADYGKGLAEGETGIAVEKLSNKVKNWLAVKADTIVELHAAKMKSNAMLNTLAGVNAGKTDKGILFDVKVGLRDYIDKELNATANVVVSESINIGRNEIVKSGQMQAAQYSAILDRRTCPLCSELDEKIVDVDSPDFERFTPPTHSNCRCVWVYIHKEEEGVEPDWSTPAQATVERYGQLVP